MTARFEIPAEKLTWRCDLSFLPFACTVDMTPLEDLLVRIERFVRSHLVSA
jgi:hypothetical protein